MDDSIKTCEGKRGNTVTSHLIDKSN